MSAIGIGKGELRVELNSRGIITHSLLQLTAHLTGNASTEIGVGGSRVKLQSNFEVYNRPL